MEQYKEGIVFNLYEDDDQEYMILKNINIEGITYLVVVPVHGERENLKMEAKKLLLLKINSDNGIEIEEDEIIIRKVIDNLF